MILRSPTHTRRHFLKLAGGAATGLATIPILSTSAATRPPHRFEPDILITDPAVKALVQRGLDTAISLGATYADVRLTHQRERNIGWVFGLEEKEEQMAGVRVLVNGYWGFAASAVWTPDTMVQLAREAVALARTVGLGTTRTLELAPAPKLMDEHWAMPIGIDPFSIPVVEIVDFWRGMTRYYQNAVDQVKQKGSDLKQTEVDPGILRSGMQFWKQEKAFGSSDGGYGTQVLYRSEGEFEVGLPGAGGVSGPQLRLDCLSPAGVGWELFTQSSIHKKIQQAVDRYVEDVGLPVKPVDVGRYDAVMDPESLARFASGTLGVATELDRALGYEANATGTSYLNTPSDMAGTFRVGAPVLTVTAERSSRGGAATTGWDDEGVRPRDVTLLDQGIVQTFQTTRESAVWLKPGGGKTSAVVSSGCACAQTGNDEPVTQTANLVLQPSTDGGDYASMVQDMEKGIAFENVMVMPDFQQLSGVAWGRAYEIQNGKKTAMLAGTGILFRSPEFWKSATRVGGAAGSRQFGMHVTKGTPAQGATHSVTAPPMMFRELTVVDVRRKA